MVETELHKIVKRAKNLAVLTRHKYLRAIDRWIEFAGEDPRNWTRLKTADFYEHLLTTMKPQSAARVMSGITYASKWYAHYSNNPALDFSGAQTERPRDEKPQRALTSNEAAQLLNTCRDRTLTDRRDLAMMVVGLETGMRRMSMISMDIESTILFPSDPRWPYPAVSVELKGVPQREWIPLSDTAVLALRVWLSDAELFSGPLLRPVVSRVKGGRRTWTVEQGHGRLSRGAIANVFRMRAERAGIAHVHPHQLRHTFITWRTEVGQRVEEIAAVTHHDVKTSLGALGGYIDLRAIGGRVRNATPPWLAELVSSLV